MTVIPPDPDSSSDGAWWLADPWLARRLGKPAWRLAPWAGARSGDACSGLAGVIGDRGFAHARIPTADVAMTDRLLDAGFRIVDTAIAFERPAETVLAEPAGSVRFADATDRDAVRDIARRSFRWSRFHLDPRIPKEVADRTRADWVDGYFDGNRGSALIVAGRPGSPPDGFLLLIGPQEGTLVIDLIAVDAAARGRGLAAAMIGFAARTLPEGGRLKVGTQAANIESLRLYGRMGFLPVSSHYVLHLHHG